MNKISDDGLDNLGYEHELRDLEEEGPKNNSTNSTAVNKETTERSQWANSTEFLMSCIAMSVGLGNIWRFPFIANKNGGGAFLIPYLITLTVVGRPMYYMEMTLGQFSSRGSIKMYTKLSPVLKGIGYGQVIGSFCTSSYYCVITAITLVYFFNSFTSNFSWTECLDTWKEYLNTRNLTCADQNNNLTGGNTVSSSEMYFRKEVLKETDDISKGIGYPDWKLAILVFLTWMTTFLISVRGVRSSGKASYFLAIFPYVIMLILFIRAATLEGAFEGMSHFIKADFSKLLEAEVWYAAVTQCFFSLGVGFGSIITYSSYNRIDHNINRDALVVTTLDTFTSLLSGFTIFGILGNLAHELNVPTSEVISAGGGSGLAFISYPDALSKFTFVPWLFSITFFFMLFVLGIGSLVAGHATINTAIKDACPNVSDWVIAASSAGLLYLIGLAYITPGGQYVLDLVDHFGGTFVAFFCAIMEVLSVILLYGLENFCIDVEFMTKKEVGIYWRFCWGLAMPFLLLTIFVYFITTRKPLIYGIYGLEYPFSITVIGWSIIGLVVLQTLGWLVYFLFKNKDNSLKKIFKKTFSTNAWGPEDPKINEDWRKFREDKINQRALYMCSWFKQRLKILSGR